MSKYSIKELWNEIYGKKEQAYDYAGRLMLKSACGNPHSAYQPTIDHIRPISADGKDVRQNIVICHWETNEEKGNSFPHWKANDRRFHAKKTNSKSSGYHVVEEGEKMLKKIKISLSRINYKLFFALLVLGLTPTVYTTVRVFFLGQLPGEYSFSIAGQLSWVNLLYEILNEAIILPLFYFVGKVKDDKLEFSNRVRTGMLISLGVYAVLSAIVLIFAEPMLKLMATDASILDASAAYIRIESIANIFAILTQFALVALVTINKSKFLYALTGARLVLCLVSDTFLVSSLTVSLNLGVNGIGYSNILVNALLLAVSLVLLAKEEIKVFSRAKLRFSWAKEFVKVGGISGVESLVRNVAYTVMIARMVNVVGEQGTYWVANNFIWGWLLLPVLQLGELIKQEVATDKENIRRNSLGYFGITAVICALWFVSIPLWKPFMTQVLGFTEVDKLFNLVLLLVGFYVLYAVQNVFDSTFYGLGKTNYMLFESVVTNTVYYGIAFVLYTTGLWTPTLTGIALLFGIGNAFDSLVSAAAYAYLLKKQRINIFRGYTMIKMNERKGD